MTDDQHSSDEHLSIDELAELDEGLLPAERTSSIRAHLHGCEQCRARADAITTTRSALADLPRPVIPDDVRERLDDAIGAQAATHDVDEADLEPEPVVPLNAVPEPVDAAPEPVDVIPAPGTVARRRLGRPTLAGGAVAAALVLAVGAIVVGALNHHHNQQESAGTAGGVPPAGRPIIASAQPAHFFQTSTGRNYTLANLTPDVQGLIARAPATTPSPTSTKHGAQSLSGLNQGTGSGSGATSGSSGTSGSISSAPGKPPKHGTHSSPPRAAATPPPTSFAAHSLDQQPVPKLLRPLARSRSKILACAAVLTGSRNAVPLAVDFGKWTNVAVAPPIQNAPSAVFVFKGQNPATVAVYVVPPACEQGVIYTFRIVPLPG